MDRPKQRQMLSEGIARLGLTPEDPIVRQLLDYIALLERWNRRFNLTSIRDPGRMISHHLLDSLALAPHLRGDKLLDAGSGAGLPGIPLAILRPDIQVTLTDSAGKKIRFLNHVIRSLELRHVRTVQSRMEQYRPEVPPATITARAVSDLQGLLRLTGHLITDKNVLLAMKGRYPEQELLALPPGFVVKSIHELEVPGLDAPRHLLVLCREPGIV